MNITPGPRIGVGMVLYVHGRSLAGGGFRSTEESQNYFLSKLRLFFYGLWVKSACPPPIFVNKILWEHSHILYILPVTPFFP